MIIYNHMIMMPAEWGKQLEALGRLSARAWARGHRKKARKPCPLGSDLPLGTGGRPDDTSADRSEQENEDRSLLPGLDPRPNA
jgi:hypothetical protein